MNPTGNNHWQSNIGNKVARGMREFANASHAMPKGFPSMHRLYNALGMISFWVVGRKLTDVITAHNSKGERIEEGDVPAILHPLYGLLDYNPYDDDIKNKSIHLFSQFFPAVCGAAGAIMGTNMFFTKTRAAIDKSMQGPAKDFFLTDAADAISLAQSKPYKILAGIFATFGSASGLTFFYGLFLNNAFGLGAGRKISTMRHGKLAEVNNTRAASPFGPSAALGALNDRASYSAARENVDADELITRDMREKLRAFAATLKKDISNEELNYIVEIGSAHLRKQLVNIRHMIDGHNNEPFNQHNKIEGIEKRAQYIHKKLEKAWGKAGVENTLRQLGLFHPEILAPGDNGYVGKVAELIGGKSTQGEIQKILDKLQEGIRLRQAEMGR